MRLLASTDYALRVLILLAQTPGGQRVSVDALARGLGGLSRDHLHKIVRDLPVLGDPRPARGNGGGVALAVPPDAINLGWLVRRLEADQPLVECFQAGDCACTLMPDCRLRGALGRARERFYDSLGETTVAHCLPETS